MLCWLAVPGEEYAEPLAADVDVTASTLAPARRDRRRRPTAWAVRARVQLKVDTGLSRGGATAADWPALVAAAAGLRGARRWPA